MKVKIHKNDLPNNLNLGKIIAIDTETMGLDYKRDPSLPCSNIFWQ
jgi:ribonuclease D